MKATTRKSRETTSRPHRLGSRRKFLGTIASVAAGPLLLPKGAWSQQRPSANDRITIGVVGAGRRGTQDFKGLMACPEAQLVAISDCRKPRLEEAVKTVNAFYAEATASGSYKGCAAYADFQEIIARPDIDAVLVAPPDHWHGIVATRALNAGKDLYCEKPIGLTIAEGQAICDAARRNNRIVQTGTQQRSDANFRHACELARNGYLGPIDSIDVAVPAGGIIPTEPPCPVPEGFDYDRWTGPAPMHPFDAKRCEWLAMYWIYDNCVGFMANWGVHHLDIAQWGVPEVTEKTFEVSGRAYYPESGMTDTTVLWNTEFKYASGLRVSFTNAMDDKWRNQYGALVPAEQIEGVGKFNKLGCRFNGSEGWVHVDRSGIWAAPASLLDVKLKPADTPLHLSTDHYADFLKSVRSREDPVAPVVAGHRASVLGCVAELAVRLKRPLKWDPVAEHFFGDKEATAMMTRKMREPWSM